MKRILHKFIASAIMLIALQITLTAQPAPTSSGPFGSTLTIGINGEIKYWDGAQWIAVTPGLPGQSLLFAPRWIDNTQGIITSPVIVVNDSTALGVGNIVSNGGANITARGVCWSLYPNPTIANNFALDDSIGIGSFSCNITGLTPGTTYHVRAFASNNAGTAYGNDLSLTTTGIMPILTVVDYDGNVYDTVKIGTQIWLKQNLKTTHYKNGAAITYPGTNNTAWQTNTTGAYAWYNNDEATYKNTYGALYNWYAVNTGNLCPTGWHVPSDAEWTILTNYLGGGIAGGKLKEAGLAHWNSPNTGATNETGFTALPGGYRFNSGTYDHIGYHGYWWSSTEYDTTHAWSSFMYYGDVFVYITNYDGVHGFSVRCLRD